MLPTHVRKQIPITKLPSSPAPQKFQFSKSRPRGIKTLFNITKYELIDQLTQHMAYQHLEQGTNDYS
jgi:hypothetical protein